MFRSVSEVEFPAMHSELKHQTTVATGEDEKKSRVSRSRSEPHPREKTTPPPPFGDSHYMLNSATFMAVDP